MCINYVTMHWWSSNKPVSFKKIIKIYDHFKNLGYIYYQFDGQMRINYVIEHTNVDED